MVQPSGYPVFIMFSLYPFPWVKFIFIQVHIFIWESRHLTGLSWMYIFFSKLACCILRYVSIIQIFGTPFKLYTSITHYPLNLMESNTTQIEVTLEYFLIFRSDILITFISNPHCQVDTFGYLFLLNSHLFFKSNQIYTFVVGQFNSIYWKFILTTWLFLLDF